MVEGWEFLASEHPQPEASHTRSITLALDTPMAGMARSVEAYASAYPI